MKIGDFGIAKVMGSEMDLAETIVGTPNYLSPELCQGQAYDTKSDIWSLGCILYEMATLVKPFDASNMPAVIFKIMRNKPPPLPSQYSTALTSLIGQLLQSSPADRPSIQTVMELPAVQHRLAMWRTKRKLLEAQNPAIAPALSPPGGSRFVPVSVEDKEGGGGGSAGGSPNSPNAKSDKSRPSRRPPRPTMNRQPSTSQFSNAAEEARLVDELRELRSSATGGTAQAKLTALNARLKSVEARLTGVPRVSGAVWEALGMAWGETGNFEAAIRSFRRALQAKNANTSLLAMEQLGNMLVRRAQQVVALGEAGHVREAMQAVMSLGSSAVSAAMADKNARARLHAQVSLSESSHSASSDDESSSSESSFVDPARKHSSSKRHAEGSAEGTAQPSDWRSAAAAVMAEGLGILERLVSLGSTAERYALLGSAYKRRAWAGLGKSRKSDLRRAAARYAAAHRMEKAAAAAAAEEAEAVAFAAGEEPPKPLAPSPYARLNQLTFELLASSGTEHECARLLSAVRQAQAWAANRASEDPADVWLWVQMVDAATLRYLLNDPSVALSGVVKGYQQQFSMGASQRVRSSVLDQLQFMATVLHGRLDEELAKAFAAAGTSVQSPGGPTAGAVGPLDSDTVAGSPLRPRYGLGQRERSASYGQGLDDGSQIGEVLGAETPRAASGGMRGSHAGASTTGGASVTEMMTARSVRGSPQTRLWVEHLLDSVQRLASRLQRHASTASVDDEIAMVHSTSAAGAGDPGADSTLTAQLQSAESEHAASGIAANGIAGSAAAASTTATTAVAVASPSARNRTHDPARRSLVPGVTLISRDSTEKHAKPATTRAGSQTSVLGTPVPESVPEASQEESSAPSTQERRPNSEFEVGPQVLATRPANPFARSAAKPFQHKWRQSLVAASQRGSMELLTTAATRSAGASESDGGRLRNTDDDDENSIDGQQRSPSTDGTQPRPRTHKSAEAAKVTHADLARGVISRRGGKLPSNVNPFSRQAQRIRAAQPSSTLEIDDTTYGSSHSDDDTILARRCRSARLSAASVQHDSMPALVSVRPKPRACCVVM